MKRLLVLLLLLNLSANAMSLEKVAKNLAKNKLTLVCGTLVAGGTVVKLLTDDGKPTLDFAEFCITNMKHDGGVAACTLPIMVIAIGNYAVNKLALGAIATGGLGLALKFFEKTGNATNNLKKLICFKNKKHESDLE